MRFVTPLAGLGAAGAIVAMGGVSAEVCGLAAIGGAAFADLARRGERETTSGRRDATDLALPLGFLAILMGAAFDLGYVEDDPPEHVAWLLRFAGIAAIAGGMVLRSSAARALGDSFVVRLGLVAEHRLVEAGPYRRLRHPNYSALLLVALGTAAALASPLALAVTVGLWLPLVALRITREERMLAERFGAAYERYRGRTWRLVPGMY